MNIEITLSDAELTEAVRDWIKKRGHEGEWDVRLGAVQVSHDQMERDATFHARITATQTRTP